MKSMDKDYKIRSNKKHGTNINVKRGSRNDYLIQNIGR